MNARAAFVIQQDCDRIVARLAVHGAKTRAVTSVVKRLLLSAPYFYNGVHTVRRDKGGNHREDEKHIR